jgi:3-oxoadipate enol-lactonase
VKFEVQGAELDVDRAGSGPVVVQAHGMTSSRAAEAAWGFDFRNLATTHTLIRYDARGHGESSGRQDPQDYLWDTLATDLLSLLEEEQKPVDAIGASMGTATILTAAVRRPEVFRRLVLVVPPTAWETRRAQRAMYEAGADAIEHGGIESFLAVIGTAALPTVLAEKNVTPVPQVSGDLLPSVLRGAARSDLPQPEALARLTLPVLLLPWVGDATHPLSTAEKLAATLPDARMVVAESAADVDKWPDLVADFLR